MEEPTQILITSLFTALLGIIARAIEKRKLRKEGKLNDKPTTPGTDEK